MKKILMTSMLIAGILSFSFQFEKQFPIEKGFDDSVLTNQMYEFKSYSKQGYLLLNYKELKKVDIYINGNKLDTTSLKGEGSKKVDISKYTKDDKNIIQITQLDGKLDVKIPYPEITKGKGDFNNEAIKFFDEFLEAEVKAGMPSAQIAVVKNGKLEYAKSFGYVNNYDKEGNQLKDRIKVTNETIYDLASNTKMYATNYAIQKLVSEGKLSINTYIKDIYPEFKGKWKENVQVGDILKHQAGFPADPQYFNDKYDKDDGIPNGKNDLYAIGKENVLDAIMRTPLIYEPKTSTKYSDVDYMLLGFIVEKISGQDLDIYLKENIYDKLELTHTMFNPLEHGISKEKIAATELNGNTRDNSIDFINARKETVWGEVHDEKAFYSMKGVSGHAGLFSNAIEVAKLAQIMVNQGGYGENKFFNRTTLDNFIKPKDINASFGLGWRRQGDYIYRWAFSPLAEKDTIGHTGWTGTLTVIEPNQNIVIVLLTNAKNSAVIDKIKKPNDFYGNHFYTTNYGAISAILIDAFSNKDNKGDYDRMNSILSDLIETKYRLITSDDNYRTKSDVNETLSLINLHKKRNKGKISDKYMEMIKVLRDLEVK